MLKHYQMKKDKKLCLEYKLNLLIVTITKLRGSFRGSTKYFLKNITALNDQKALLFNYLT